MKVSFSNLTSNPQEDIFKQNGYLGVFILISSEMGGDVAQLVKHRTGTPPTLVQFPSAERAFLPESTFSAPFDGVCTPPCAITRIIYICAHVKDPVVNVRVWWIMETLSKTPSMQPRMGSSTLLQLAFPREDNPNFPWEKS